MNSFVWLYFCLILIFYSDSLAASNKLCNKIAHSDDDCHNGKLHVQFDNLKCLLDQRAESIEYFRKLFLENQRTESLNRNLTTELIKREKKLLESVLLDDLHRWERLLVKDISQFVGRTSFSTESSKTINSCKELSRTDKALLRLNADSQPFWILCVQKHHLVGNGWLVILHRVDGTSFNHDWIEYREGFGNIDSSFWLGLEKLHQLTLTSQYELLVEVADFEGTSKYARYSRFVVNNEARKYSLDHIGTYSGTAGDGLRAHLGRGFTTYDDDNDRSRELNCAVEYTGGWWYDSCFKNGAHLTGTRITNITTHGIVWTGFSNPWKTLKYARMMIRKLL